MLKAVLVATTALTIAGSTLTYAQQGGRERDPQRRWQPSIDDIRAFQAARLAALRAGLVLNAEQDKHWPAFEQAARELQQLRVNRVSAMREARRDERRTFDPVERLRQRATRMTESGTALKKLADATDPLYRSLDDAQRRRFVILSRMMGPQRPQFRGRDRGQPDLNRGQRRTDLVPGEFVPGMPAGMRPAGEPIVPGKTAGMAPIDTATPVISRKTVDAAAPVLSVASRKASGAVIPIAPVTSGKTAAAVLSDQAIAGKSAGTNIKAVKDMGFNHKPTGFNRKDEVEASELG
jgi:hypothetical protein